MTLVWSGLLLFIAQSAERETQREKREGAVRGGNVNVVEQQQMR